MALALPAGAGAHAVSAPAAATALGPTSCPGAAIQPSQVITGEFASELQGSFVLLPFQVPAGTTAVRVKYCWDPPIGPFVAPHARPGPVRGARPAGRALRAARVPRLGRLEPPGRDRVSRGLQERGGVRRQPAHERARQDHARLPARTDRARRVGGRAGRRRRRHAGARRRRTARWAGGSRSSCRAIPRSPTSPTSRLPTTRRPARRRAGLVRRRHARPRRALRARRRDHDGDLRLRVQAAFGGRRRASTSSRSPTTSCRPRGGRSAATSPSIPGKLIARSAEVITYRGHTNNHTSAHLRRLPHRPDLRARARRHAGAAARPAAASRAVRRRARRRRLHPDQPSHDLPLDRSLLPAVLPRVPVGLHRRGDRLLEAWTRSR